MWERSVQELSGGEKNRLLLASLFLAKVNCLLLDEPTNHLDLESRESLVQALQRFPGTVCLVAHDRYLLSQVPDEIWMLSSQGIHELPGGYTEYEAKLQGDAAQTSDTFSPGIRSKEAIKEKKRLEARQRNERFKLLRPKKERYASLEQELEQVLVQQNNLEDILADPQTYVQGENVGELNKQYQELQARAESIFQELEALEQEVEELEDRS
jgi:ATP-binding cassette subfamily F protein 3